MAEEIGERLTHPLAQFGLDELLGEVVGDRDQGGLVEQSDQPGQVQEGTLGGGDAIGVEHLEGRPPDHRHRGLSHECRLP